MYLDHSYPHSLQLCLSHIPLPASCPWFFFFWKTPLSPISKLSLLIFSWVWGQILGYAQPTSGHGPRKNDSPPATAASNCCNLKNSPLGWGGTILYHHYSVESLSFLFLWLCAPCFLHNFFLCLCRGGMWVGTDSSEELLCTGLSTHILLIAVHVLTQPHHFPQAYSIWLVPRALPLTLQEAASFVYLPYSTAQWEDEDFVFVRMASFFASCSWDKDHDWK